MLINGDVSWYVTRLDSYKRLPPETLPYTKRKRNYPPSIRSMPISVTIFKGVLAMADERSSGTEDTPEEVAEEMQEAADRAEQGAATAADEAIDTSGPATESQILFSETAVVADVDAGDENALTAVGEQVVETPPEDLRKTTPDLEPVALDESAGADDYASEAPEEEFIVFGRTETFSTGADDLDDLAPSLPEDEFVVIEQTESVTTEIDDDTSAATEEELVAIGPAEAIATEAAVIETPVAGTTVVEATAAEPEVISDGFTTLQALILAFLVLLNVIVIGLGIWQLSLYFGWL
jgi:hypothetical protein